jgi:hypothetical protein
MFLMRYRQFNSRAYSGGTGPVFKMTSQQEKAFCVLRLELSRSVITVQREFRARHVLPAVLNRAHRKPFTAAKQSWKLAPRPRIKHEKQTAGSA